MRRNGPDLIQVDVFPAQRPEFLRSGARQVEYELDPDTYMKPLVKHLRAAGADGDPELISAAQDLLRSAAATPVVEVDQDVVVVGEGGRVIGFNAGGTVDSTGSTAGIDSDPRQEPNKGGSH